MSVEKNPAIESLDPKSLCHGIYNELYNQFFQAQEKKDDLHPWGVEEGDDTSIRLHNAAYGFAYAIAGAVDAGTGAGGEGGILLNYLRKDGGDMSGMLRAHYGLEAGIDNKTLLSFYKAGKSAGVTIQEDIDIRGSILMAGEKLFDFDGYQNKLDIHSRLVNLGSGALQTTGELFIGNDKQSGIHITPLQLTVGGKHVYHEGNANVETVDWRMKNGVISGHLTVGDTLTLSGELKALHGVELGADGRVYVSFHEGSLKANCHISFGPDYGIRIDDKMVLGRFGTKDIGLSGIGGDLLLGGSNTNKIKLLSGLLDEDGDYVLISPHGAACFPDSLTVRHNFGNNLLSSYRVDNNDEGIVIHKRLRMHGQDGPFLESSGSSIGFFHQVEYTDPNTTNIRRNNYQTFIGFRPSTSLHRPLDRDSDVYFIHTNADLTQLDTPIEAKNYIGIENSLTRLTDGALSFSNETFLLAAVDGIKHYGNSYFLGSISSELFSSGFAGSGWAIQHNRTTGNATATVDELTVRKRMRIFELEVQKNSVTNGALWISNHCQGDTVERVQ